jgi:hypothetical protein
MDLPSLAISFLYGVESILVNITLALVIRVDFRAGVDVDDAALLVDRLRWRWGRRKAVKKALIIDLF